MNDTLIYDWLYLVTGSTAVKANQNGPRPSGNFLTWQIIAQVEDGQTSMTPASSGGNNVSVTYQTQTRVTVSVQSWGSAGRTPLEKLTSATHKYKPRILLADAGVRFIRGGAIRDLTQVIDTKYSPVYQVDLEFMAYMRDVEAETDWTIDQVNMTGEFEDADGSTYPVEVEAP